MQSLDASPYIAKKLEKRVDNVIKYILCAGKKALHDAHLAPEGPEMKDLDRSRCGILIGSAMGGMTSFSNAVEALTTSGEHHGVHGAQRLQYSAHVTIMFASSVCLPDMTALPTPDEGIHCGNPEHTMKPSSVLA